jgi:hypothetical protein
MATEPHGTQWFDPMLQVTASPAYGWLLIVTATVAAWALGLGLAGGAMLVAVVFCVFLAWRALLLWMMRNRARPDRP